MAAMAPMWKDADLEAWRRAGGVASTVRVRDVMSWPALTITAGTTVGRAAKIAAEQGVHHLVVVRRGELMGVLCTCDLKEAPEAALVASRMTRRVIKVDAAAPLTLAAELMEDYDVGCLPSLWLGAWGIVTVGDLARTGASPGTGFEGPPYRRLGTRPRRTSFRSR